MAGTLSPDVGAWSLLPPLVALGLAVRTRAVVPALAAGSLCGLWIASLATVRSAGDVPLALLHGALDLIRVGLFAQPASPGNAQILVLILIIGGFVGVIDRTGGTRAIATWLARGVRTPRSAQLAAWAGGLAIFFSDFGNTLILGPVFRPVFDRLGVSRLKLAYVIDATAAPVCVLVPFIAWGVYVIGLLESTTAGLPVAEAATIAAAAGPLWDSSAGHLDGFSAFMAALPYQIYPWMALILVPMVALSGRDLGAMGSMPATPLGDDDDDDAAAGAGLSALAALATLATVLALLLGLAVWTDGRLTGASIRVALAGAYLAAVGAAVWGLRHAGAADLQTSAAAFRDGVARTLPLALLLVLAWTLSSVCKDLGTGQWLAGAIGDQVPAGLIPLAVFAVAAAMSLATGTSWGTFAIAIPLAIPMAAELGAPLLVTVGAALSGGVFGDHASPISDTTLLASVGADVDHAEHVATQLPYAGLAGVAAAVGLLVAGLFATPAAAVAGIPVLVVGLWGLGRPATGPLTAHKRG